MSDKTGGLELVTGSVSKTFFKWVLPNIAAFIAIFSINFVDLFFVGKYAGYADTLFITAAYTNPIYVFINCIAVLLSAGGAVITGKYLGENDYDKASAVFTRVITVIAVFSLILSAVCLSFGKEITGLFAGLNDEILTEATGYSDIVSLFFIFQTMSHALYVFVRLDGNPYLAAFAAILGAAVNFICDYHFIVNADMGIKGAAWGTGISYIVCAGLLTLHFIFKKGDLRFVKKNNGWKEIFTAAYNGSSECLSSLSIGITAAAFNFVMVHHIGAQGIAAFAAINYAIYIANMLCFAAANSLTLIAAVNYGAKKFERIKKFTMLSCGCVFIISFLMFLAFSLFPERIIGLFLNGNDNSFAIALNFAFYIRYAFFFIGLNIAASALFTGVQKPFQSLLISLLRGLILPVVFIVIAPVFAGNIGLYTAVPLAEIVTFLCACVLFVRSDIMNKIIKS